MKQAEHINSLEKETLDTVYNYEALPKKRMASGVLFLNEEGHILIVKPSYRKDWLFPGGAVEDYESPKDACIREVKEELNLDVTLDRLLCIEYLTQDQKQTEAVQFVFYGGVLTKKQTGSITFPDAEVTEFRFSPPEEAVHLLSPKLAKRLPHCLYALQENFTVYLEDGEKIF